MKTHITIAWSDAVIGKPREKVFTIFAASPQDIYDAVDAMPGQPTYTIPAQCIDGSWASHGRMVR